MNDSIEEQLKKLAAEKKSSGGEDEITEMIENSTSVGEKEEEMRIVTAMRILLKKVGNQLMI